jgi:Cys-tRNA(Pro)/Cys-tRNA(Cys) deacylase
MGPQRRLSGRSDRDKQNRDKARPERAGGSTPAVRAAVAAGVPHEVVAYTADPAIGSYGAAAAAALGVDEHVVFKTLVTDVDGALTVAVVPVAGSLDLKALAAAAGAKHAGLADPGAAERATGYVVGGISPLGQRRRLPTVVDASALDAEAIYVSAGRRGLQLRLAPGDLIRLTGATVAAIAR